MKKNKGLRDNAFRVKIDYEEIPITDTKVNGIEGLDKLVNKIKKKIGGSK